MTRTRFSSLFARYLLGALLLGASGALLSACTAEEPGTAFEGSLRADYYFLPEDTRTLPDFETLTPEGQIENPSLNVSRRNHERGFPGVPERTLNFGVLYTGTFTLETEGVYTFTLRSDDGSKLFIDNELIVDLDGLHDTKEQSEEVTLDASTHALRVEYFQGPGEELALQLRVTPPGESEEPFTVK